MLKSAGKCDACCSAIGVRCFLENGQWYILTGMIVCQNCGHVMATEVDSNGDPKVRRLTREEIDLTRNNPEYWEELREVWSEIFDARKMGEGPMELP